MVTLELFNNVGAEDGITVEGVKSFLNDNKQNDIQFDIATLGGDLATAITIHDLIKNHPKKTIANIIGLTASAGTIIAIACKEVKMSDNALFLIHNGWREMTGNVYDFQKAAAELMKTDAIMVKMYHDKTGLPDEKIKAIMKESDWLSPNEALSLGFVDEIKVTGNKIAACITDSQRQKINNQLLLTKLEEKMKLFGKEKKDVPILNILALKDGRNVLINAESVANGVEVAPLGAMTLEDGEYPLEDGRIIVVSGGAITDVKEAAVIEDKLDNTAEIAAQTEAIIAGVVSKVMAEIEPLKAKIEEFNGIVSKHSPMKGKGPVNIASASVKIPDVQSRVKEITDGIREEIEKQRKA